MADQTSPWTDDENDRTVDSYFRMLDEELAGDAYNKALNNRMLQETVNRKHKAIEFKHQNISAVLLGMGLPWIDGYKPASNFQMSLIDAVLRWLAAHPDWSPHAIAPVPQSRVQERGVLWIGPPPTHSNVPPQVDLDRMAAVALISDASGRDHRNRMLGRLGEARVLDHERASLSAAGRADLAGQVKWVSDEDGDGAGYDIASFEVDGQPRLIEVKTTNGWERTPFHITRNELRVADEQRDHWHLVRSGISPENRAHSACGHHCNPMLS